jgi:hypothetical protein
VSLAGKVTATAELVGSFRHPDHGSSEMHQGLLTMEGVNYRVRCSVFTDAGRARFVADVAEFVAVAWRASMRLR